MTPRVLAEAAGVMELPVTETGNVGRGAVLDLFYFIIICVCWGDGCRSEKFGFGHDDFEVRFRHPRGDAEQASGYRSWGFGERAELDLQTGCHWQIGGVSRLEIVCGHLGSEYRQKKRSNLRTKPRTLQDMQGNEAETAKQTEGAVKSVR